MSSDIADSVSVANADGPRTSMPPRAGAWLSVVVILLRVLQGRRVL